MARFKEFPDELILPIILFLDISALLPFALINKHIHSICVPRLSKCQALHKEWNSITLSYKWDLRLVDILIKILDEPECVRFIRECVTDSGSWTPPTGPNVTQRDVDWNRAENLERLGDSLVASPLVGVTSFKMWMAALNKIDETAITTISYPPYALIWSLLPDLHTIEIPAKAQRDIAWLRQSQVAPKLKRVQFGLSTGLELGKDSDVTEILRLPSLRELNATCIRINSSPIMSHVPLLDDTHCPLERLAITCTPLTPYSLNSILQQIHKDPPTHGLQSFTYKHHQTAIGPFYTDFNGPALIATILTHTQHSLTELDLAIDNSRYGGYSCMTTMARFCTTRTNVALGRGLKSFENLQRLTVAAEMLVEGWRMQEVRESYGVNRVRTRLIDVVDYEVQQTCLGEVLPLSLRVLKITSSEGYGASQRVVMEKLMVLLEWWYFRVPFLRVLELGWWPEEEQLRLFLLTLCDRLGVQLVYDLDPNW